MAKSTAPVFTQKVVHTGTTFVLGDGTAYKPIAVGGIEDSRVTSITLTSDDELDNTAFFALKIGVVYYPISWVVLPTLSGTDGVTDIVEAIIATTFLHRQIDNNANPYFDLQAGVELCMKVQNSVSAAKTVTVLVTQEDY